MRRCVLIATVCIVWPALLGAALGQTPPTKPPETPKQISGGVLNGKATRLPKPNYPEAAKAVGASGPVTVQVLIDEQGYVATAKAVSGHPLLLEAAVEAAHSARFSPTTLNGIPVRVSGIITYNFVTEFTPVLVGYELAFAERTGAFGQLVYPDSISVQLPADWTAEKEALDKLEFAEPGKAGAADKKATPPGDTGAGKDSVPGETNYAYVRRNLSPEGIKTVRNLQAEIESRLRTDPARQWAFKVGRTLGQLAAEIGDENGLRLNTAELEQLAATPPAGISDKSLARLRAFVEKAKSAGTTASDRKILMDEIVMLKAMRF